MKNLNKTKIKPSYNLKKDTEKDLKKEKDKEIDKRTLDSLYDN